MARPSPWTSGGPCDCPYCMALAAKVLAALAGAWGRSEP